MRRERRIAFMARLPIELDDWIEEQAARNLRSKNAEIEFRLRAAMEKEASRPVGGATAAGEPARV